MAYGIKSYHNLTRVYPRNIIRKPYPKRKKSAALLGKIVNIDFTDSVATTVTANAILIKSMSYTDSVSTNVEIEIEKLFDLTTTIANTVTFSCEITADYILSATLPNTCILTCNIQKISDSSDNMGKIIIPLPVFPKKVTLKLIY